MQTIFILAHAGHELGKISHEWIEWIGGIHLIILHFPIALINMLVIAEILFLYYKKPIFEFSSRFMLLSSAILSPPTAILGYIYSYSAPYTGLTETFLFWHMWFGIATATCVVFLPFINSRSKTYYLISLILLFILINITGFFGGGVTFGLYGAPSHKNKKLIEAAKITKGGFLWNLAAFPMQQYL